MSVFSVQDTAPRVIIRFGISEGPIFLARFPSRQRKKSGVSEIAVCACVYISTFEPDDQFSQDLEVEKPCH